jgi:hypothetical protein
MQKILLRINDEEVLEIGSVLKVFHTNSMFRIISFIKFFWLISIILVHHKISESGCLKDCICREKNGIKSTKMFE